MGRGRKRKQGNRTKSGQLSRAGKPAGETLQNRPSDWVKAQQDRYGNHYNSPIGRAYAAGLLGEGNEAKERFDNARKFASLHRRVMGGDFYRCALNDSPRGMNDDHSDESRDQANHEWLLSNIKRVDDTGCRPFLDQLLSKLYTDYGPPWLDSLLNAKQRDRRDTMILDAAIKAIDAIAPEHRSNEPRILVARWA